ncbi:NUDIX domain-containing protein [Candidatus Cardinium hertigii]|uniref:Mutator protein MutT4 n=1 Tax=Candidatus Cardinium hertigii TaxID=247481 RepID=A0A2Z3L9B8_9BACT|nr:NUDIX domain-containing protein [Candidatus Cardinium hertigii]AWN81971.1 Putative mutator protein MutT4 [Candidatus Cardinium hertigii]
MYTKTPQAAGGILVQSAADSWNYLALLQKRMDGNMEWLAPKGHMETGENPLETARREIAEETGLKSINLIDFVYKQMYSFEQNDCLYNKTVYWYLFEVEHPDELVLSKEEGFVMHKWVSYKEALELFSYRSFNQIIQLTEALLNK